MKRFINDIKKYYKYAVYAAKAELKSEVAGSYLGWLWWFLEPACFMLVYAFVVMVVFNAKEDYMLAFVFVGNTIWTFFNKTLTVSVKAVQANKNIVSKVYIPKYVLVIVKLFVNFFKMTVAFGLVAILMILYKVPITFTIIEIIPIIITLTLFSFGIGTIFAHFGVFIEDLSNIVNILLRLVFYLSGIFYSVTKRIPAPYGKILGTANPIAFFIEQSRGVLLYGISCDWIFLGVWFVISVILCIIGIKTIYKYENSYVKVI